MTIALRLAGKLGEDFMLDVALEVPPDGVTALLGPSGSGKTSVLRALAGLDRIDGEIRFGPEVWQNARVFLLPEHRRVAYVFQGIGLLPHLSVRGNLDFAERRARPGPFRREDIIERAGVGKLLDRMPARLSGGEAQRAAIARALLSQPRLLLMDEPLSALDGDARNNLLAQLAVLLADIQIPVFYVTHDLVEAERLSERTIRLVNGRIA
jgi:molybdate transport system ATP-binding protein